MAKAQWLIHPRPVSMREFGAVDYQVHAEHMKTYFNGQFSIVFVRF